MIKTIENTEIELNICGQDITCVVSGYYFPAEKATTISPPVDEKYELDLELESGENISELLCNDHVFKTVIEKLKQSHE